MNKQPEALRLAEHLELNATHQRGDDRHIAAAELRRLHTLNQELLEALKEIVDAADGTGWEQLDPSFKKARAAIAKAGEAK